MASGNATFAMEERKRYRHCVGRLLSMVAETGEKQKNELNSLLDELNSLAFSMQGPFLEQEPGRLLCQACTLVPLQEELLVTKVCQLIVIITHQKVVLSQATVETLLEYITAAITHCQPWTLPETLRALGAVVYENGPKCIQFLKHLLGINPQGLLLKLIHSSDEDVKRPAVQCIGNLCMRDEFGDVIDSEFLQTSYNTLLTVLQTPKPRQSDDYGHFRLLLSTLRGLQNILAADKDIHLEQKGAVLAALKAYMLYGLPGVGTNFTVPPTIYPSPLYQHDSGPSPSKPSDSTPARPHRESHKSPSSKSTDSTPGRLHHRDSSKERSETGARDKSEEEEFSLRPGGGGGGSGLSFALPKPQQGKKGKKKPKAGRQERAKVTTQKKGRDGGQFGAAVDRTDQLHIISAARNTSKMLNTQKSYPQTTNNGDPSILYPAWGRVSSSESEYSDTEGGQASKLRSAASKVRQAALTCLLCVIKNTEKKHIFGYWSAFIPDTPPAMGSPQSFSLFTSMLKDPAPKARVGSVVVLAALLDGSRQFLAAADDSDRRRSAFTPFSHTLASTIKEIHRCLLLALMAESFSTTLTQIIKCLSILVQNVPYHKLSKGLLTRVIKGIRPYFTHKDNNVRTACLTCMGAILSTSTPLAEVSTFLQSPDFLTAPALHPSQNASPTGIHAASWRTSQIGTEKPSDEYESPHEDDFKDNIVLSRKKQDEGSDDDDIGVIEDIHYPHVAAPVSHKPESVRTIQNDSQPETRTSNTSTGININFQKPTESTLTEAFRSLSVDPHKMTSELRKHQDKDVNPVPMDLSEGTSVSWLVKWCTDAILTKVFMESSDEIEVESNRVQVPSEALPVRLEALQVLTQLVKGYFAIVRDILDHMCTIVISCLEEGDPSVKLHGLKVLEELGKAMLSQLNPELETEPAKLCVPLTAQEVVAHWDRLLSGPLPAILQNSSNAVLQSSACYCLSTIGPQCFELLKMNKRVLCITLLLGLRNEEDYRVKAAAVRALGAYVLYPCLREDVMFVADTANAILTCLKDASVNVRIRAAWSIGNLSDALIANKEAGDSSFLEEFSDMLLQKLFLAAIAGASDHDKVKSNAVRALGMLVRFTRPQALAKSSIQTVVTDAIQALLGNINSGAAIRVKVRWNACYAMGNVFKNTHLDLGTVSWSSQVFTSLTDVVRECKNFKVRINAALALSIPAQRCCYGDTDRFCLVWSSIVQALEVIDQVADVSELRYRDTLRDQLCQTLTHLAGLITPDDLSPLHKLLKDKTSMLESHIGRYKEAKSTPISSRDDRGNLLTATTACLQDLMSTAGLTAGDRNCVAQLLQIFACT